jgi:hypothetical protein
VRTILLLALLAGCKKDMTPETESARKAAPVLCRVAERVTMDVRCVEDAHDPDPCTVTWSAGQCSLRCEGGACVLADGQTGGGGK